MNDEYAQAIEQARANLADIRERGEDALISWEAIKYELFTPEEIAAGELEARLMFERTQPEHELENLSEAGQPGRVLVRLSSYFP